MFLNQRLRSSLTILMAVMIAIISLGVSGAAAQQTPIPPDSLRTISVSGTGIVSVTPDTASVSLGVIHTETSLKDAQDKVTTDLGAITTKLKEAGIADDDLATSQYNVRPINKYDGDGNFVSVDKYEVSVSLNITVRDLDTLGSILDSATAAGANQIWGISMYVDDTSTAAAEARTAAMKDARSRAESFARSEGLLITGVYTISETQAPTPKAVSMESSGDFAAPMSRDASNPVPISIGTTEVRVDVQVVYVVEQGNG